MQGCRLSVWIVAACLLSGCEVGRTMFQMDSNSGQPFFGVDLLRSRKSAQMNARPAAATNVVAQLREGPSRVATPIMTVSETKGAEPSLLERLKLKRPAERIGLPLAAPAEDEAEGPVEEFR